MEAKYDEAFSHAVFDVMSQFGLESIKILDNQHRKDGNSPDVNVKFSITGDVHGNVVYSMGETLAKKIASLMMGMGVEDFDDLAKSAVCELGNMLAANGCTGLASQGITSDISTPQFLNGEENSPFNDSNCDFVELEADELPFFISLSLTA